MPQGVGDIVPVSSMISPLLKMCHTSQLLYTLSSGRYESWTLTLHMKGSPHQQQGDNQGKRCNRGQFPEGEGKSLGGSMGPCPAPFIITAAALQETTL